MNKLFVMARRLVVGMAISCGAGALLASPDAHAVIGTLDAVPAATLLLPYFEVNLADPNGEQTRFTVINATATPQLAHATLWTDMGVPTFSMDIYLGGRDSQEVDLRLLFSGVVPQTSPTTFTAGPYSSAHTAIAGCPLAASAFYSGMPASGVLSAAQIEHLRNAHTGKSSPAFGNMCAAAGHGDSIARGYVTIDAVNTCSSGNPNSAGYFVTGGAGVASNANVLFGSYTMIERQDFVAMSSALLAIEASGTDPLTTTAGTRTFYGGTAHDIANNREAMANRWQARSLNVAFFEPGSELVVWRDPLTAHAPFTCGNAPADFPRGQRGIVGFDEEENPVVLNAAVLYPNPQPPPILPFPLITQRLDSSVVTPFAAGSIYVDLSNGEGDLDTQVQSYVSSRHRLNGLFGAALPGQPIIESAYYLGF